MKHIILFVAVLIISVFPIKAQKLVILASTDLHSKLTGFGPESAYSPLTTNDDNTTGGFARIASIIKNEKNQNPDALLTIDAGDFLMGTIFHADEKNSGFQLPLMKEMGFDILAIGNHEFDFGPDGLAEIINASKKRGEIPYLTAAQMQFPQNEPSLEGLRELYRSGTIRQYIVTERKGIKIGLFGLIGEDAAEVAPDAKPVFFSDMYKTAEQITHILKEIEQVDIVICLSHSGLSIDETGNFTGEDYILAQKVPEIDIIISGHTHLLTEEPVVVGNTRIIQSGAYGKHIARIELDVQNGNIQNFQFKQILVDDKIAGDIEVHNKIEEYKKHINRKFFEPFGLSYDKPVAETHFDMIRSTAQNQIAGNMGNFLANAISYYTNKHSEKADLTIIANGTIREHILTGEITPADIFRVLPLGYGKTDIPGNSLARIYITQRELKQLMEVIIMSNKVGTSSYLYIAGPKVYYNPNKMILRKVQKIELDGKEIDISRKNKELVSITADTYLLQFVGQIRSMSKGLVNITPKDKNGEPITTVFDHLIDFDKNKTGIQEGKKWLAAIEYLQSFDDTTGNGLPEIPAKYKNPTNNFYEVK